MKSKVRCQQSEVKTQLVTIFSNERSNLDVKLLKPYTLRSSYFRRLGT